MADPVDTGDGGGFEFTDPVPAAPQPLIHVPPPKVTEPPPPEAVPPPITEPLPPPSGVPEALPGLPILAGLIVILGLILLVTALSNFSNWLIRSMFGPLWTKVGSPQLNTQKLAQPLSNALGAAYAKLDPDIGLSFNKLGQMTGRTGSALLAGEQVALALAIKLGALQGYSEHHSVKTAAALGQARLALRQSAQAAQQAELDREAAQERAKGLDGRLAALETHITTLIEPELEGLRDRLPSLEHGVTTAWDEIAKHGEALGIGALTASTAVALAKLGAGWVECEANQLIGKAACRSGPNAIKNLLEGLFDIAALLDLCQLVSLIATAAESSEVTAVFTTLTGGIQDLIDCRGIVLAKPLSQTYYTKPGTLTAYALPGALV